MIDEWGGNGMYENFRAYFLTVLSGFYDLHLLVYKIHVAPIADSL